MVCLAHKIPDTPLRTELSESSRSLRGVARSAETGGLGAALVSEKQGQAHTSTYAHSRTKCKRRYPGAIQYVRNRLSSVLINARGTP